MSEKKSMVQEFKEFITTGDLMSVAVAFIMALAIKAVIDSFVKDIFTGVLGLFVKCEAILDGTGKKIGENCSGLAGKAYKKMSGRQLAQDGPSDNDLLKEIRDSLKNR